MTVPASLLLLAVAAVTPSPGDLRWNDDIVNARSVIAVDVPADRASVATGDYWAPRQRPAASLLSWLVALAPGGASPAGPSAARVDGLDPLQTALLLGAGVARGRDNAVELGYHARQLSDALPTSSLAVALWTYDAAGDIDLSAGRQILALGTLRGDGSIGCPREAVAGTAASMPDQPDVILVGACAQLPDPMSSSEVVRVNSLDDAVLALSQSANQ